MNLKFDNLNRGSDLQQEPSFQPLRVIACKLLPNKDISIGGNHEPIERFELSKKGVKMKKHNLIWNVRKKPTIIIETAIKLLKERFTIASFRNFENVSVSDWKQSEVQIRDYFQIKKYQMIKSKFNRMYLSYVLAGIIYDGTKKPLPSVLAYTDNGLVTVVSKTAFLHLHESTDKISAYPGFVKFILQFFLISPVAEHKHPGTKQGII